MAGEKRHIPAENGHSELRLWDWHPNLSSAIIKGSGNKHH
jgi:hypothetical protein